MTTGGTGFHSSDMPQYPCGLYDLFTAMGGKLNVNTASIRTLQLIPGIDEGMAARIFEQRAGPDGQDGTDDDVPFQNPGELVNAGSGTGLPTQALANYVDVRSYVFQVKVEAQINDYKRIFYGIVSRGGGGGQQIQCVKFYWE